MSDTEHQVEREGWNWAPVPAKVILSQKLTHADVRVYGYLLWRAGKKEKSWPLVETIARDLTMSEPSVKRSLRNLSDENWIRRNRRMNQSSMTYVFEYQEDCLRFDIDPSYHGRSHVRITGDTTDGSPEIPLNENHIKENQLNDILQAWRAFFPGKSQPKTPLSKSYRKHLDARLDNHDFVDKWQAALERASRCKTLQAEGWFSFEFFIRNDENYQKMLAGWVEWKDGEGSNGRAPAQPKRYAEVYE